MKTQTQIYGTFNCADTPTDKMVVSQNFDANIDGLLFHMGINNSGIESSVILDRNTINKLVELLNVYLTK